MSVSWNQLATWLAEHDIDANEVESLEILRADDVRDDGPGIYLRATVFAVNTEGRRYFAGDEVARDVKHVLLAKLPPSPEASDLAAIMDRGAGSKSGPPSGL